MRRKIMRRQSPQSSPQAITKTSSFSEKPGGNSPNPSAQPRGSNSFAKIVSLAHQLLETIRLDL